MKVCILGATGNSGRRLVQGAVERGHEVTAVVRNRRGLEKFENDKLVVREIDFDDEAALKGAMQGQDVVINAAGNANEPAAFTALAARIIRAADAALGPQGRLWLFAGAALLDFPGSSVMTLSLPRIPKIYMAHRVNYEAVRKTGLDWSILCPGPMIDAPDGRPTEGLVLSTESWPMPAPGYTKFLPPIAKSIAFMRIVPRITIYYEDAAKIILDHLERQGPFSRRRVGVALPDGETRRK